MDPVAGKVSVVASLTGSVGVFSENGGPGNATLLSTIPVREMLGAQGHTDPHDALFLPSGDIVVRLTLMTHPLRFLLTQGH